MNDILSIAAELVKRSVNLDRDFYHDELDSHCWPLVDALTWSNPMDIWTFNAALYYGETIQEQTPAHLLSGGLFNEWQAALRSDRFISYRNQEQKVLRRVAPILSSPLLDEIDPFWLLFPNNLNLLKWDEYDIAALLVLSAYSSSIRDYKPFGSILYIHGYPQQWVASNAHDPVDNAFRGLELLTQPLRALAEHSYKMGTFN